MVLMTEHSRRSPSAACHSIQYNTYCMLYKKGEGQRGGAKGEGRGARGRGRKLPKSTHAFCWVLCAHITITPYRRCQHVWHYAARVLSFTCTSNTHVLPFTCTSNTHVLPFTCTSNTHVLPFTCTSNSHVLPFTCPSNTHHGTHRVVWTIGFDHMSSEGCYGDNVGVDSTGSLWTVSGRLKNKEAKQIGFTSHY